VVTQTKGLGGGGGRNELQNKSKVLGRVPPCQDPLEVACKRAHEGGLKYADCCKKRGSFPHKIAYRGRETAIAKRSYWKNVNRTDKGQTVVGSRRPKEQRTKGIETNVEKKKQRSGVEVRNACAHTTYESRVSSQSGATVSTTEVSSRGIPTSWGVRVKKGRKTPCGTER